MSLDRTKTYRRRLTLAAAVIVVVSLVYFFMRYGTWEVINGMDTMTPEHPPGATCIVQKSPGSVPVQSVVVLALPDGAALLTRVSAVDGETLRIRHDNRESRFLEYEKQSYSMRDVRALVLTTFAPEKSPSAPAPRARK